VIAVFQNITRTALALPGTTLAHVTPLTPVQVHIIALLNLPADLYDRLASPAPQPLAHLRE